MLRQHRTFKACIADAHRTERATAAMNFLRQQFFHIGNDGERQAQLDAALEPFQRGVLQQSGCDDRLQLVGMMKAADGRVVYRIGSQFRHIEQGAEPGPLRGCYDGDAEPAMLGLKVAARIAAPEAIDAGPRAGETGLQRKPGIEFADVQHGFEIVDSEASRAVGVSIKSGKTRNESGQSAHDADLAVARQHRRAFDGADQFHQTSKAAAHRVSGVIVAVGAMFAEPRDRGDGEAGIGFAQALV